jgi:UDP-N-acetylmuramoylalanine--D-glutamate ligase
MLQTLPARHDRQISQWAGRRVTVMGLGVHGGALGAARFLAEHGARVTISDTADAATLTASLQALHDVPIEAVKLGGHDADDFRHVEFVMVNPAIRPNHPCLDIARRSGATLTSEIELFLRHCRGRVIGVTGSNGKSTTCAMVWVFV